MRTNDLSLSMVSGRPMLRVPAALLFGLVLLAGGGARAQLYPEPPGAPLTVTATVGAPRQVPVRPFTPQRPDALPVIMLTGYWPPTNDMLRPFSPNPDQNPEGWVGENWEDRGYHVIALFPEFPFGLGRGQGDFEVDYQDTSADFWRSVDLLQPMAIITFGRAYYDHAWQMEGGDHNFPLNDWGADYLSPYRPTADLPIAQQPPGSNRWSTLPSAAISAALVASGVPVTPLATDLDDSGFLCNFIGYHACWYHDLHADPADPAWNIAAGHIHVGYAMSLPTAMSATEVTLRALIGHLNAQRGVPDDVSVLRGRQVEGGLADLHLSDDARLVVVAPPPPLPWPDGAQVRLVVTGHAATLAVDALRFAVEARTPPAGGLLVQRIALYDWTDKRYRTLDVRVLPAVDTVVAVSAPDSPARYIQPVSGELRALLEYTALTVGTGPLAPVAVDRTAWTLEPARTRRATGGSR